MLRVWPASDARLIVTGPTEGAILQLIILIIGLGIFAVVAYGDMRTRRIPNELIVAILALAAFRIAVDGDPRAGLYGLAVMAAFGLLVLLLTGRSETVSGLTIRRDERFAQIDLRATAFTGLVLVIAVIVAWLVEIGRGQSGHPYDWLGAIGGLAYLLAVAFFRWRG